jgi:hypothetical protein
MLKNAKRCLRTAHQAEVTASPGDGNGMITQKAFSRVENGQRTKLLN